MKKSRLVGCCRRGNNMLKRMMVSTALLAFTIAISLNSAFAASVSIDIDYDPVPGRGDSFVEVTAFFDDSSLTNIGNETVTLSSLDATITSVGVGLNSAFFHLPNTDILCRSFPGVSCFASVPYTATFQDGSFRFLAGVQGLHGTTVGSSNYPVNNSILFQLGFNPANSFGPLAQVRYALPNENVHSSLRARIGDIGPVVPVPAAAWLFGSGLIGLIGIARRKKA